MMGRIAKLSNGATLTVTLDGNWLTLTSHERNLLVILMNQVDSLEVKQAPGAHLPAQSSSESTMRNERGGTKPEQ